MKENKYIIKSVILSLLCIAWAYITMGLTVGSMFDYLINIPSFLGIIIIILYGIIGEIIINSFIFYKRNTKLEIILYNVYFFLIPFITAIICLNIPTKYYTVGNDISSAIIALGVTAASLASIYIIVAGWLLYNIIWMTIFVVKIYKKRNFY